MIIFEKFSNLILISLILNDSIQEIINQQSTVKECVISNQKYKYDYLFNSNFTVYSIRINKVDSFDQLKWKFLEISGQNHTYFIKSSLNNKYLCAGDKALSMFDKTMKSYRSNEVLSNLYLHDIENYKGLFLGSVFNFCKWQLNKKNKNQNMYKFINIQNNKQVYLPTTWFRVSNFRLAFIWNGMSSTGDEFNWSIVCRREEPLYI